LLGAGHRAGQVDHRPAQAIVGAEDGDQQAGVAAAQVDDVTKCAPGVGSGYGGRVRHQPGSHQGVKRRCPSGVGRQVVPERAAELTRERGLAGTDGVQQLDEAQIGAPDSTLQIDPRPYPFWVIVTEVLTQCRQAVGAALRTRQHTGGHQVAQQPPQRVPVNVHRLGQRLEGLPASGDVVGQPQRRRHPDRHRGHQVGGRPQLPAPSGRLPGHRASLPGDCLARPIT